VRSVGTQVTVAGVNALSGSLDSQSSANSWHPVQNFQ
jgi:hypothetical protein